MKATDPQTAAGAQVTISENRKNNCRAASSASESGQVKVDIGGDMLAIATTKTQHEHLVPQNPSDTFCQTLSATNGLAWTVWRAVVEMPKSEVDELQGHGHSRQRPHPTLGWRMASTSCQPLVANCWPLAAHGCCRPLAARVNLGGAKVVLPKRQQSHNRRWGTSEFRLGGSTSYRTLAAQRWPLAARR